MTSQGFKTSHQYGFSLIELMVAMTLGLVLTFGVITFFQDSLQTSRATIGQGELQEIAQMALNTIRTDAQMAGFRGECVPVHPKPPIKGAAVDNIYAVAGDEADAPNSDILRLFTADIQEDALFLWNYNRPENELTVCANEEVEGATCEPAEFETDDLLLVSDCQQWAIFKPNKASSSSEPNLKIKPAPNDDGVTSDLNDFRLPGSDLFANNPKLIQGPEGQFVLYRVGSGTQAGSTTYQLVRDTNPDHQAKGGIELNQLLRNGEPILYGVENLQVLYGIEEQTKNANGSIKEVRIRYREGCTDTEAATIKDCAKLLNNASHLRISMVVQSDQRLGSEQVQTLQVADRTNNGRYQSPADGRLRRVYTTTVQLRNANECDPALYPDECPNNQTGGAIQ